MNRKDRRTFNKLLKTEKKKLDILQNLGIMFDISKSFADTFHDGDTVLLDVDAIVTHPDYNRYQQAYKDFVEQSKGKKYTMRFVKGYDKTLVTFKEDTHDPKWFFWTGYLQHIAPPGKKESSDVPSLPQ